VKNDEAEQLRRVPELWVRLKLLAGDVAERLQDLPSAAAEYSAALQAAAPQIKAHACYRLAKVFERSKQVDEALATFQRGIDLLQPPDPLLATLHIHRAWVFIQPRPDRARAESDLHRAESLLQPGDLANQADLHNAWAGFYTYLAPDPDQAIAHRLQYWLLSRELGDIDRQIKAALNVGQDFLYEHRSAEALAYLEQGLALAIAAGDRSSEARYYKIVGNAYFFQAQCPAALEAYLRAYPIVKETGNWQWLARVCYDLAEVYAQLGEWETGNRYWEEGLHLAETLNDETARRDLAALERTYPRLRSGRLTVEDRRQRLLDYLAQHEAITRDQYQALTGVQKAQAARDLKSFAAQRVVEAGGKGPAARYHLMK
jgi:tetratricopeptide (TPR) repeat protein